MRLLGRFELVGRRNRSLKSDEVLIMSPRPYASSEAINHKLPAASSVSYLSRSERRLSDWSKRRPRGEVLARLAGKKYERCREQVGREI